MDYTVHNVCMYLYVSLPPAMKKVKHRLVEKMNESTADSLGLSRAVLVNGKSLISNPCMICMYMYKHIVQSHVFIMCFIV